MTQEPLMKPDTEMPDKFEAAKWKGEPCPNPIKGWIVNSRGNRLTHLGNINAFVKIIQAHNNEIELLRLTAKPVSEEERKAALDSLEILKTYMPIYLERDSASIHEAFETIRKLLGAV
jgi:hypothetical protein